MDLAPVASLDVRDTPVFDGRGQTAVPFTGSVRTGLDDRSRTIAVGLRESLEPIVRRLIGRGGRPAALARTLGIDRTLAARILRAIRAEDTVQVLQEIPAPNGLRIFLDAAARIDIDPMLRARADEQVKLFEQLIDEFPGGRSALDAAIAEWDPSMRLRTERAAKQAMHKSMSCLLGYQVDTMLVTIIIQPSADGRTCDALYVMGKYNIRRLRASAPITVFGRQDYPLDSSRPDLPRVENLQGDVAPAEGDAYLLPEYCSPRHPRLGLFNSEGLFLYTLPQNQPAVNDPVTYVSAQMVRNGYLRYRTDRREHSRESHVPRMPAKVLIADVFLRDDVYPGTSPFVMTTLHGLAQGPVRPDNPRFQLDRVDLSTPLESLGTGIGRVATRDVPRYADLMQSAFDGAGWDAPRFRGYRCRVQYPVPLVAVSLWFDLPQAP